MFLPFYTAPLFISNANPASFEAGLIYFALFFAVILNVSSIIVIIRTKKKDEIEWHYLKSLQRCRAARTAGGIKVEPT